MHMLSRKDLNSAELETVKVCKSQTTVETANARGANKRRGNSVCQKITFRCGNQCSEKTLSFWQLASVVTKESEESYTTNLCQRCYNDSLTAEGEKH